MNIKLNLSNDDAFKRLITKLEDPDQTYQSFVKKLSKHHFHVKAIIQDILECRDSMESLNELNEKGRAKLTELREELENLELYGKNIGDPKYAQTLESERQQLARLLREFKEANIISMFAIEKAARKELMNAGDGNDTEVRNRKKKVDRDGLLKMSTGVTEQLLAISRQLADTTQRSQDTLDNLVSSSSTVHEQMAHDSNKIKEGESSRDYRGAVNVLDPGTQQELQNTAGTITQSSKLLKKYGRREFTDKLIMFFAFLFFLAVCLYIVQKRLF